MHVQALARLPLDLDPDAPPLVTHRLRQPNQKDITYLLSTWKGQWAIERRLAKVVIYIKQPLKTQPLGLRAQAFW